MSRLTDVLSKYEVAGLRDDDERQVLRVEEMSVDSTDDGDQRISGDYVPLVEIIARLEVPVCPVRGHARPPELFTKLSRLDRFAPECAARILGSHFQWSSSSP